MTPLLAGHLLDSEARSTLRTPRRGFSCLNFDSNKVLKWLQIPDFFDSTPKIELRR